MREYKSPSVREGELLTGTRSPKVRLRRCSDIDLDGLNYPPSVSLSDLLAIYLLQVSAQQEKWSYWSSRLSGLAIMIFEIMNWILVYKSAGQGAATGKEVYIDNK